MNIYQQEMFEKFVDDYGGDRVIAVNGLIEELINKILEDEPPHCGTCSCEE